MKNNKNELNLEENKVSEGRSCIGYKTNEEIKNEGLDLDQAVERDSEVCWLKDNIFI